MATLWSYYYIHGFGIPTQPRPDTEFDQTGTIDIRAYYIRHVSRIILLYYVAIIIFAVAQKDTLTDVFLAASFVQFLLTGEATCPLAGQWYICLPAIIWGLMHLKRPMLWLCIAIVISPAVRFVALAAQTL